MEGQTQVRIDHAGIRAGCHAAGQAQFGVAGTAEKIQLAALAAHQHIGAGDIGAAGQVETDERNLAGAGTEDAAVGLDGFQVALQGGHGLAGVTEQAEQAHAAEGRAGDQTTPEHVAAADGFAVAQI